jgi:hypothetical protein
MAALVKRNDAISLLSAGGKKNEQMTAARLVGTGDADDSGGVPFRRVHLLWRRPVHRRLRRHSAWVRNRLAPVGIRAAVRKVTPAGCLWPNPEVRDQRCKLRQSTSAELL